MNQVKKVCLASTLSLLMIACGGPKETASSDQTLATDIQAKLYNNDATRSAKVNVAVNGGVVTLSGEVPSSDVALQAVNVANGTAGIKSVSNQLRVAAPAPSPMAAAPPVATPENTPAPAAASQFATPNGGGTPPPPPPAVAPPPVRPAASAAVRPPKNEEMVRHETAPAAPAAPARPRTVTIPVGEQVSIRMIDSIDTGKNHEGETFRASLNEPITVDERVIVPAGASVSVLLAQAKGAGRIKGQSELELRLTSITYHGEPVRVSSSAYEAKGSSRGKQSAIRTGIGAAAGAAIGAIAGGGKGAAIGSIAGGGAGAGYQLATHGQQIKIPSETQLTFRLEAPLTLTR